VSLDTSKDHVHEKMMNNLKLS